MKTHLIKLFKGSYNNPDVFQNVLRYVANKDSVGGYALCLPPTESSATRQFLTVENQSLQTVTGRKIWHFIVSIQEERSKRRLLLLGEQIAALFRQHYQVLYALDLETGNYHVHFAVNAYSYNPLHPPLTFEIFEQYRAGIKQIIHTLYPFSQIIDVLEEGRDPYYV